MATHNERDPDSLHLPPMGTTSDPEASEPPAGETPTDPGAPIDQAREGGDGRRRGPGASHPDQSLPDDRPGGAHPEHPIAEPERPQPKRR